MTDDETKNVSAIDRCARCGESHEYLSFSKIAGNPIDDYNYWALCPVSKSPVLMKITGKFCEPSVGVNFVEDK